MRANLKTSPSETACSFDIFVSALDNPAPAFAGMPRTLRDHIGAREFGDFGTVLMAERPASADLTTTVERWRDADVKARADLLLPHPDQIAEDRRFNNLFVITPMLIVIMVLAGLIGAWMKGVI